MLLHLLNNYSLHTLLLVPVCKVAWYDDSNSFVAGFMDGVICLATKDPDVQVKIVEAHKVRSNLFALFSKVNGKSDILQNLFLTFTISKELEENTTGHCTEKEAIYLS